MRTIEKKYLKSLIFVTALLLVIYLVSLIYSVSLIIKEQNINPYIFELIYSAFHLIVLVFAMVLVYMAMKSGSFFMKGLMTLNGYGKNGNKKAQAVALTLSCISFLIFIYFLLVLFKVNLPYFNFPMILIMLIINTALLVFTYGLYFFLYPILVTNKK